MTLKTTILKKEEEVMLNLRGLFEQYGYKKFKMGKFEEYDFYAENRKFLSSDNILTFNNLNGKLMALKPDITLSIVKYIANSHSTSQRVYYNENIYRAPKGGKDYKEIMQVGLEYIGELDGYVTIEVLSLAKKSLELISSEYIMDISHMGFVTALIDSLDIKKTTREQILEAISGKNIHQLEVVCEEALLPRDYIDRLMGLTSLYGTLDSVLPKAQELVMNPQMEEILSELTAIVNILQKDNNSIHIDLSMVNNSEYYDGIIFKGFIDGISKAVLSGGCYSGLLHKLGKDSSAIGFALYLDQLERFDNKKKDYDADILVIYDDCTAVEKVMETVEKLVAQGKKVIAKKQDDGNITYESLYKIT